jgi:sterol 14-demethylase
MDLAPTLTPLRHIVDRVFDRALGRPRMDPPPGFRAPPELAGGLPGIGHTADFIKGTVELLFRAQREHSEICTFNVFNRKMVALFGPEAHEAVFRAPDAQLSPMEAYKIMTPVFGKNIVYDATPERMGEQLKMLLPALKDRRMRTYGEAVVREVQETTSTWGEAGVLDFVAFCRVLTNYTSSRCLLGKEFREGMNEEFAAVYTDLERGVTPLAYINAHLPIPSFRARDKARVRMVEMITQIVDARRRDQRRGEDFLQTLMDSQYTDGNKLTGDEITGMLLAGMFAGHHTSSVTTAWALIELLRNPAVLARCKTEIDQVFGGGRAVTHALLRELSYTENVVKETLRLHPPLFMLVRVAKQDFMFKEWFIPAGSWVLVSPTVAHMIPEVFAEPARFEPDRYAPPREEDKRDFAFIAFGGGRHKCLGNAFAILQIKAILAMLLGQYEFELSGDEIAPDFHGLVIGPKEPCRVRYRRRADATVSIADAAALVRTANELEDAAQKMASGDPAACPVPHGQATAPTGTATTNGKCPVDHTTMAAAQPEPAAKKPRARKAKKQLRIVLDTDLCQGHAVCVGECADVFYLSAEGKVAAKTLQPSVELNDQVREAARHCPTRAIKLEEQEA